MKLSDNPLVRALAVVVMIAAGIRLVFELLAPVWPYLFGVVGFWALWRVRQWWLDRW